MIFDRTEQDVINAISIRDSKVKKGIALTEDDITILEKGFFTQNCINRIDEKELELFNLWTAMGYYPKQYADYRQQDTEPKRFTISHYNILIDNAKNLRKSGQVYDSTPLPPSPKYHYQNLNNLEKMLYDLGQMATEIQSNYLYCGEAETGV